MTLRYERDGQDRTSWEVVEQDGRMFVMEVNPPQDVSEQGGGLGPALADWVLEHAPGRTAAAARLALGYLD